MAQAPPTIVSLKQNFLTAQTRLLSQPLAPTRAWRSNNSRNANNSTEDASHSLPDKAVDDALFKLNHRLQQHARRVYAPQATRHVAEQIDQLYWNAAEAAASRGEDGEDGEVVEGLGLGADLADPAVIATLPPEWDVPAEVSRQPADARRYAELAAELHALAERKRQAAARVARLRRMRALLEPFDPSFSSSSSSKAAGAVDGDGDGVGGGTGGVQENLVTRDGEVETELHRMRMLLARVGGRVGMLKEKQEGRGRGVSADSGAGSLLSERGGGAMEVDDVDLEQQRKVGQLLESF